MNRKTIILFVVAFTAAVAMAMVFFSGAKQPQVKITYGGGSQDDSNKVFFVVSNPYPKTISFTCIASYEENQGGHDAQINAFESPVDLASFYQTNVWVRVPPVSQWTLGNDCYLVLSELPLYRLRFSLSRAAENNGFYKLGGWLSPPWKLESAPSVKMLGNQPAPPEQK